MIAIEADKHRKREYIIVKHGQQYYYARANINDPCMYQIMTSVGEKEGRDIVTKANESSEFNRTVDKAYEEAIGRKQGTE